MASSSRKDADTTLQHRLEKLLNRKLSPREYQECRSSLYYLGRAIARFHKLHYEKSKAS